MNTEACVRGQKVISYWRVSRRTVSKGIRASTVRMMRVSAVAGEAITSKEFRTWGASLVVATALLASLDAPPSDLVLAAANKQAATALGNTPAVCKRASIHPDLIEL
jgi:DNA topoisomerase IB